MSDFFKVRKGLQVNELVFPTVDGTANQVLQTDGNNNIVFASLSTLNVSGLSDVAASGDYTDLTNTPSIPTSIADLDDVSTTGVTDGQVLAYDNGTSTWQPTTVSGSASDLDSLTDVDTSGVSDGQVLSYDNGSSTWIPTTVSSAASALDDLTDVDTTGAVNGSVIKYNGTSWVIGSDDSGSSITVQSDGVTTVAAATTVNFTGDFTVSDSGSGVVEVNVDIGGGSSEGNAFETVTGDSGSVTATTPNDVLTIAGGTDISTSISGSTLTVAYTGTAGDTNQNAFSSVALSASGTGSVSGDTTIASTVATDTLNIVASDNVTVTGNNASQTITIESAASGGSSALDDLTDVDTTGVSDGQVLTYDNGTSTWVPTTVSGGGSAQDTIEWVRIDYTLAGEYASHTTSAGIDSVTILTTASNNITFDVAFDGAVRAFPPVSIRYYGYVYDNNQYVLKLPSPAYTYSVFPGGSSGSPTPNPFGSIDSTVTFGSFKVDRDETGAANAGGLPTAATHAYILFGF